MAKTDLYNERKREGRREEGEIEKAACSAGLCRYGGAAFFIVTRLYPLNKQRKRLLICCSRKMAKTDLYNER